MEEAAAPAMDDTRVTALMPLKHYHPDFLRQALRSLLDQSCPRWRLLIIIEAANHQAMRAVLQAALTDRRVKLIVNRGRKLAGAINTGMRAADTEFVAELLADDMWSPDAVGVLNDYIMQYPDVDFFHSSRRFIDEHNAVISSVYPSRERFTLDDFLRGSPVKHLLCWRRDTGLAVGGLDESLNSVGPDDYDLPWTMAEHGARFRAVRECLYYYRDHRECYRLTTHLPLSVHQREIGRILRKHGVERSQRSQIIARARQSYLRQCLYRTSLERRTKERLGFRADRGWRETYSSANAFAPSSSRRRK